VIVTEATEFELQSEKMQTFSAFEIPQTLEAKSFIVAQYALSYSDLSLRGGVEVEVVLDRHVLPRGPWESPRSHFDGLELIQFRTLQQLWLALYILLQFLLFYYSVENGFVVKLFARTIMCSYNDNGRQLFKLFFSRGRP
jgi:hypothetical protein